MRVAIGLGGNLGDRHANLRAAAARVGAIARVLARSHLFETAPVGGPPQPHYLNAAMLVEWDGPPLALLDALMTIEADLGRVRDVPNGPRSIDLDVLWIEGQAMDHPRLIVPHPRLHERAFALAPLVEIAPDATDLREGRRYVVLDDPDVRRLDELL